jgi:hypothetical protein
MIQTPSSVDVSKLTFGPVKVLDNGGKMANLRYESRSLTVETPSLSVPWGVGVYDKAGPPKYSVDLSLRGADVDERVGAFQKFLEAFDEQLIEAGVTNAPKWFKMTNPSREVIRAFYTPSLKFSRDATGALKPYPPTLKLNLRKNKDGLFEAAFYNGMDRDENGDPTLYNKTTPLDEILPKWTTGTAIIQCTGVWLAGAKFGASWKVVQFRVDSLPDQIRGPAFRTEAPDIRAYIAKTGAPKEDDVEEEEEEEEEDEVEEDVVAAALPSPPVTKKHVITPPVVFEEEVVSEPIPVPKKVVKRVSAKKA